MDRRFIPTHVGNTYPRLLRGFPCPVHPHACGEHEAAEARLEIAAGSSPRMWGTHHIQTPACESSRFIPTHVGNTPRQRPGPLGCSVHPHACGEHSDELQAKDTKFGSSPRMWGTLCTLILSSALWRFIPTHVGNTVMRPFTISTTPVHPHACGEHIGGGALFGSGIGSSPRMWGTQCSTHPFFQGSRFIPTHVGNTVRDCGRKSSRPVHPHACGEHWATDRHGRTRRGSSPRMWGTPHRCISPASRLRFIPTHVGNTRLRTRTERNEPVHPHACGEHVQRFDGLFQNHGSSPRMWGTP